MIRISLKIEIKLLEVKNIMIEMKKKLPDNMSRHGSKRERQLEDVPLELPK